MTRPALRAVEYPNARGAPVDLQPEEAVLPDGVPEDLLDAIEGAGLPLRVHAHSARQPERDHYFTLPWVAEVVHNFMHHPDNVRAAKLALARGGADPVWVAAYEAAQALSRGGGSEMVYALLEEADAEGSRE